MLIANPISDLVFKWLMEDKIIARFFIETLLDEPVVDVEMKPQELPYEKQYDDKTLAEALTVFRVDFVATTQLATGEYKKVLIEIQKARNSVDVMRFRNYLAEHYKKEDTIPTATGTVKVALPIITVYLLGFKLPELETALVHIAHLYIDKMTNKILDKKSKFAESLTHECYIVQIPRIEARYQNRLERLLSFFEQKYFIDENGVYKNYPYPIEDEYSRRMADSLHYAGTNPEKKKRLEVEQEALRVFNLEKGQVEQQLEESKKELEKSKRELDNKDKVLEEKNIALDEKDKELNEKDKALSEKGKELNEKDKELNEKDKELSEKDKELSEIRRSLLEKDKMLEENRTEIKEIRNFMETMVREISEMRRREK